MGKSQKRGDKAAPNVNANTTSEPAALNNEAAGGPSNSYQQPTPSSSSNAPSVARWSGGSWRQKANPVAEMTKESISSVEPSAQHNNPSRRLSRTLRSTGRASSSSNSTARQNVASTTQEAPEAVAEEMRERKNTPAIGTGVSDGANEVVSNNDVREDKTQDRPLPALGWRGWWSRPAELNTDGEKASTDVIQDEINPTLKPNYLASSTAEPNNTSKASLNNAHKSSNDPQKQDQQNATTPSADNIGQESSSKATPQRSSWFGLWSSGQAAAKSPDDALARQKSAPAEPAESDISTDVTTGASQSGLQDVVSDNPIANAPQPHGSWAFWSREKPKPDSHTQPETKDSKVEAGDIAVANTASETQPQPTQLKKPQPQSGTSTPKSGKRGRPPSADTVEESLDKKSATKEPASRDQTPSGASTSSAKPQSEIDKQTRTSEDNAGNGEQALQKKLKQQPTNLLLPQFRNTYQLVHTTSYWEQLLRMFGRNAPTQQRHLSISTSMPKLRKAIAVGIHGYFPTPLLQKVIGQPTGTSIRFATGAAAAIQKWATEHGCSCEVEKVALEGEGMIVDRVDILWKLLLNWIDQIRKADLILVACHSQGVPVATQLVAKLLEFGCINNSARIGICAMAGVNLGPFASYQSRFFGGSAAGELFDFGRPESTVSQKYQSSLSTILKHHVRIVYTGSIDDQLVSMESSTFSNISHPYIYRAVFVDGRIHAPDFLTHLVGFALKLRNLGIPDHGLIRELSAPLAGSLYAGEGHSRVYEDQAVYELAVQHTLETTTLSVDMPLEMNHYEVPSTTNSNPYFLPWAMRGVLEEEFVRTGLKEETGELLKMFEDWRPSSKVLKDVKFRLEAVKSKL